MTTTTSAATAQNAAAPVEDDHPAPVRPLSVNIRPILESVAGRLTPAEIDEWFHGFDRANEARGFYLELTSEGELVINVMVNRDGARSELRFGTALEIWAEQHGGEAYGAGVIVRLPDGSRVRPDAAWLSPQQVAQLPPVSAGGAITLCPAFIVEIISASDTLPPLQRKMERYIANGAQLGWLIDPYRRQVHLYQPNTQPQLLNDPETLSGDPTLPNFTFEIRRRIFNLHQPAQQE